MVGGRQGIKYIYPTTFSHADSGGFEKPPLRKHKRWRQAIWDSNSTNNKVMDTRVFLFRSSVTTTLPFDVLVGYLKRKTAQGVRFKLGYIDKEDIDIYYSNDYAYGGYYERLGLDRVPNMQVITNDKMVADGQVTINFQTANFVLVIFGLIGALILSFGLFIFPTIGLTGPTIILVVLYLIALNDFTKQLSYFKYDLGLLEKDYKIKSEIKTD